MSAPASSIAVPAPQPSWFKRLGPGLLVVAILTLGAMVLQSTTLFSTIVPMSSLILAILLGLAVGNLIRLPESTREGIKFSAKRILRLAIVFLGFKLSFGQVVAIGPQALITILIASTATILFTPFLGKLMGIPMQRSILIGSGVSICGAAAVAAVAGAIDSEEEDAAFAISVITLYGTVYIFLYPALRLLFGIPDLFYAMWAGASVHEVAQVAAATTVVSDHFRGLAATVKMIRVLFIVPLTLILPLIPLRLTSKERSAADDGRKGFKASIPWFAILFFVMVVVNSFAPLPGGARTGLVNFDNWMMTAAMAGLGLDIRFRALVKVGPKAALLGAFSSIFLSGASALLVYLLVK